MGGELGTTNRGIGPAYADRALRVGLRMGDLADAALVRARLERSVPLANAILRGRFGQAGFEIEPLVALATGWGERLAPYLTETTALLHAALAAGQRVLLEGAQGALLDLDQGTYPYVTSSNPVAGGASTGSGIGPRQIDRVVGVMKAYVTRVGAGPFPTELHDATGEHLRQRGHEFGTTTGRPRRCGWFDAVPMRHAVAVNTVSEIMLNKLDILSGLPEVRMAVGYRDRRAPGGPLAAHAGRARAGGAGLRGLPRLDGRPVGRGFDGRPATCRRGASWRRSSGERGRRSPWSAWGPNGRRRSPAGPGRRWPRDARGAPAHPDPGQRRARARPRLAAGRRTWCRTRHRGARQPRHGGGPHRRPGSRARRGPGRHRGGRPPGARTAARPRRERPRGAARGGRRRRAPRGRLHGPGARRGRRAPGGEQDRDARDGDRGRCPDGRRGRLRRGRPGPGLRGRPGLAGRRQGRRPRRRQGRHGLRRRDVRGRGPPRGARGRPLRRRRCARRGGGAPERPRGQRHGPLRRDGGAGAAGGT